MTLTRSAALDLVGTQLLPAWQNEKGNLDRLDKWYRWDHDPPHQPRQATPEYKQLSDRAQTPWLTLVVTSVAQNLYVDGYRRATDSENATPWEWWQANGMDAHQIAIHRAALAYGMSYASVLPGADPLTGDRMPVMRGHSPRQMIAVYRDPVRDEFPEYALSVEVNGPNNYALDLYDDTAIYRLASGADIGAGLQFITFDEHNTGVCPIVRYANLLDLEGRSAGEVEPFVPVASRIDQTTFDRLVVQRFASWIVRTIAGMAKPDTEAEAQAAKLRLRAEDILVAEDPDTKFGSLPASNLDPFISAADADIRVLAASSQTPAHELLGQLANLSAEALAAARASLNQKVFERKQSFGESHERVMRLAAWVMGDREGARDRSAQVRWADTETRSLSQAADALGKMATLLNIPVEMLWERLPQWTQQDTERALKLKAQAVIPPTAPLPAPAPAPANNGQGG